MNDRQSTRGYDVVMQHLISPQWWPCSRNQLDETEVVMLSHSDKLSHRFPFDYCSFVSIIKILSIYSLAQLYFIFHETRGTFIHCKTHSKNDKALTCMFNRSKNLTLIIQQEMLHHTSVTVQEKLLGETS